MTNKGLVILLAVLAIAGALDYYANVALIIPNCRDLNIWFFVWNTATATLYVLSAYVAAALGAFHYVVVGKHEANGG